MGNFPTNAISIRLPLRNSVAALGYVGNVILNRFLVPPADRGLSIFFLMSPHSFLKAQYLNFPIHLWLTDVHSAFGHPTSSLLSSSCFAFFPLAPPLY
jgi:hypothetical protein